MSLERVAEADGAEFAQEVALLVGMGFTDIERNLALLRVYEADLSRVVDSLLADFEVVARHRQ